MVDDSFVIATRDGREFTIRVDADDLPRVLAYGPWHIHDLKHRVLYASTIKVVNGKRRSVYLHRFIADAGPDVVVDHENQDGLDCRRCNLRVASKAQNQWNRKPKRNTRTGLKGVNIHRASGRWQARIRIDNKVHSLGYHATPELAHAAYCEAAKRLHGEFARTS